MYCSEYFFNLLLDYTYKVLFYPISIIDKIINQSQYFFLRILILYIFETIWGSDNLHALSILNFITTLGPVNLNFFSWDLISY